ncbi:MAG TPA: PP2C family serine/threonine-protein phosphatase [Anaerolineales bacterium]|nr:PP2C family serine/threonine-protein phosphatase [Anaerolineales bacterium]
MNRTQRAHLNVAALSHAGRSGKNNEDRYAVASYTTDDGHPVVFAVVSDGIGGHRAGEVAAELAVNYISQKVEASSGRRPLEILESAIDTASQAIAARSASKDDQQGMGATCVCAWIVEDRLYTGYVGDSRIYLMRNEKLQRLTIDHSWVQEAIEKGIITPDEARNHPNVHVIRRHLGSVELPGVDFRLYLKPGESPEDAKKNQGTPLHPGDILLLCTDGLTDMVWDDEILHVITTRSNLKSMAEDLIDKANERGGHDNITVVLLGMPKDKNISMAKKQGLIEKLLGE